MQYKLLKESILQEMQEEDFREPKNEEIEQAFYNRMDRCRLAWGNHALHTYLSQMLDTSTEDNRKLWVDYFRELFPSIDIDPWNSKTAKRVRELIKDEIGEPIHKKDSSWDEHCGGIGRFKARLTYPDFGTYLGGSAS